MSIVSLYAKRVVVLRLGEKILDGPTEEVFRETEILKTAYIKAPQIFRLMAKFPQIKLKSYDIEHVAEEIYNYIKGVDQSGVGAANDGNRQDGFANSQA